MEHPRSLPEYVLLPWSTRFEDPIVLPDGRKLLTLKDAADYVTKLPKKESDLPEWQTAIEMLMLCSRGGHPMMARIGVMRGAEPSCRDGCSIPSAKSITGGSASYQH